MIQRVPATFKNGAFVPDEACDLPENTRVEVIVPEESRLPSNGRDEAERKAILQEVVKMIESNPIPVSAPAKFTREELHERR